jgi:hypothetical protein
MYLFLFLTLYMFRAHRDHQERQIVSTQPLVTVTVPGVILTQFVSPDDEHDVLETCRELKIKINT